MKTRLTISKTSVIKCIILLKLFLIASLNSEATDNFSKNIHVDGILNEQVWADAKIFKDFVQIQPAIFDPSSVKSEIYFTYDSQNIYFAGKIFQDKNTISAINARKDDIKTTNGDYVKIGIDPLNNGNSAYFFLINPVNAVADGKIDNVGEFDYSSDVIFLSGTNIYENHWVFELKIPLTSISFQNIDIQTWGLMFSRYYASGQEISINQLLDKNSPYRVTNFFKVNGIEGLKKDRNLIFTPYLYGYSNYSAPLNSFSSSGKLGGEIKYNPSPSTTILATINPDYAQIETDKEVINVSDLPTTYPEKRPFFTESSDMYPGRAFYSRNIADINAGIKIRSATKKMKLDLTSIYDRQKNLWAATNVRYTDNKRYHFEILSGIKSARTDYLNDYTYNFTMHGKLYFFNKQLQIYTWYGTVNSGPNKTNEYESVSAAKWISRNWNAGLWNSIKSELYDPGIVGIAALSNQNTIDSWLGYTYFNKSGFFRKTEILSHILRYDLVSNPSEAYYENTYKLGTQLFISNKLGNWEFEAIYKPNLTEKFRYRNKQKFNNLDVYTDVISQFVFVEQAANSINLNLKTDASKQIGSELSFDNKLVRKSKSNNFSFESFLNVGSRALIAYTYGFVKIAGSPYQNKYEQSIHRIKTEYNFNSKTNIRFIYQPIRSQLPDESYLSQNYNFNTTFSWEFTPGGNIYIVYNNFRKTDQYNNDSKEYYTSNHSLVLKISKTI